MEPHPMNLWQGRIYQHGRYWRYELRMPSGGGWHSRGFHTYAGAQRAFRAAIKRKRDQIAAAIASAEARV